MNSAFDHDRFKAYSERVFFERKVLLPNPSELFAERFNKRRIARSIRTLIRQYKTKLAAETLIGIIREFECMLPAKVVITDSQPALPFIGVLLGIRKRGASFYYVRGTPSGKHFYLRKKPNSPTVQPIDKLTLSQMRNILELMDELIG